jgi:hypothetical protein
MGGEDAVQGRIIGVDPGLRVRGGRSIGADPGLGVRGGLRRP